ncbi:MAG TPA: PQQ-dependent dehydrogenase, methanol/ethanol family, partial [Burkholderiales bacterium]|nr:PQQ-dependent dehydrogenase, methanol/ethanol family [Burkholderiales bacterium]
MKRILCALFCAPFALFPLSGRVASAQTTEELLNAGKNTDNVLTFGMGYDLKMFSPLKQIDKSNVKRLVPVWSFSTSNDMGDLSQPTVYNGVM